VRGVDAVDPFARAIQIGSPEDNQGLYLNSKAVAALSPDYHYHLTTTSTIQWRPLQLLVMWLVSGSLLIVIALCKEGEDLWQIL
jgi:hypothetical protein